jgi:trafficking protein particle complex subunit 10
VIDTAIDEVLTGLPEWHMHKIALHAKFIEMLESDASWVEIYAISGELNVPGMIDISEELREPVEEVKKAGQ